MKSFLIAIACLGFLAASIFAEETPQQFEGFNLAGYGEGGKKAWDVQGDKADIMGSTIKVTNIVANSYGEDPMHLTAKNGTLDKTTGNMQLQEDVVITTDTGATLSTDSLDWARDKDLVTTQDQVTITKESMTAVGTGATAQPGLNTAQLNENVTVTVEAKGDDKGQGPQKITITCDGPLEIDYKKQQAVFNNNVVAFDSDRKLLADKVEVYFNADSKKIKEMVCIGNVQISRGDSISYSEKAVYNADDEKVILSGNPKIVFYPPQKGTDVSSGDTGTR